MVCRQCGGAVGSGTTRCMRCQATPAVPSKKRAVLVGIQYTRPPWPRAKQLKGTINDVRNMRSLLTDEYNFPLHSIRILTDYNQRDPKMMPEKENILRELRWLVRGCSAGDSLVFYFSGHGDYVKDKDRDETDGWDEVICALDKNIVDDEINKIIVHPLVRGVKLHAIIDSCHSGTVLDLPKIWNGRGWTNNISRKGVKKGTSGGHAIMISGCTDHQFSNQDSNNFGLQTGHLTSAFHATVMNKPHTRPFTYASLFKAMKTMVEEESEGEQTPQMSSSFEFDINQKHFTL
uniref:Uncharacterized protein n=1 Tax=Avena sativa TaxID=4498 RepID=A0ACD5XEK0_AVESA